MFRFRVRTEAQPRTKNGRPAHSTTGVARASWIQFDAVGGTRSCTQSKKWPPISKRTTGTLRASPIQNLRVMSRSSSLGPVSAVTITGSSAIPQIGHAPGPGRRISGCIGQVHSVGSAAWTAPADAAWAPWSCPA